MRSSSTTITRVGAIAESLFHGRWRLSQYALRIGAFFMQVKGRLSELSESIVALLSTRVNQTNSLQRWRKLQQHFRAVVGIALAARAHRVFDDAGRIGITTA